ncbi:hypothetical protein ABZ249_00780 [Nocardiopsis sp. NPDC006139]|uniref:hypothetical protein n=1 Tax=Nocardiopsis sp. NPDC006139 TaxID=3154578 RepID=UPI00339F0AEE
MPTPPGRTLSPSTDPHPIDPLAAVRGRILLHVRGTTEAPLEQVSAHRSGVVFSGAKAVENLESFIRDICPECPTVLDPSEYERHFATPAAPFTRSDQLPLPGVPAPRPSPESAEPQPGGRRLHLTPTRYLRCDEDGEKALREAVAQADEASDPALILAVPIDAQWLTERTDTLISLLHRSRLPKALILGDKDNPTGSKIRAKGLRQVISSCSDIALLRTDLAAVDAMVHGAVFASIGDTSSARHAAPPGSRPWRGSDSSPNVLYRPLLRYIRGAKLARYLGEEARDCFCSACAQWADDHHRYSGGRPPTGFLDPVDARDAHAHNMAVWSRLWAEIARQPSPEGAREYWRRVCDSAVGLDSWHHKDVPEYEKVFAAPAYLRFWAGRPERRNTWYR